jgi:hypothetical protein
MWDSDSDKFSENGMVKLFVKSTQDVDIWMETPIQHDVYIWANYSVSVI